MTESRFNDDETASAYENLLLPLIFNPWSQLLLSKARLQPGQRVLDLACGPGTLARLAAQAIGRSGHVTGADNSPKMLAQAKAKPDHHGAAMLDYIEASASSLPFPNDTFDLILCQQGLQFFPDQLAALKECERVLKPNGRLILSLWSDVEAMSLFAAFHAAMDLTLTHPPTRAALGWLSIEKLTQLLAQAGFSQTNVSEETLTVELNGGMPQAMQCVTGTTSGSAFRNLNEAQRKHFEALVKELLDPYTENGVIQAPTRALLAQATA